MSDTVIKVENLSKLYRLGTYGSGTLKDDIARWWAGVRGTTDPTKKVGAANILSKYGDDYIWALKDINFEVKKGEVLGIIGRNGAGKSTLLKILSEVTSPTEGKVKVKGRVASLLEVGTGMHPELTGRENIFLNGAILGMTKAEIRMKLDEIIDFAGILKYADTPVKRYSSGMRVRLGFAVAAFLEPEILIVDEVLAVGDAEFQKKAIWKIQSISEREGRTVLLVSHNMVTIQKLCTVGILLNSGQIANIGNLNEIINEYINSNINIQSSYSIKVDNTSNYKAFVYEVRIENLNGQLLNEIPIGMNWRVNILMTANEDIDHFIIALGLISTNEITLRTLYSKPAILKKGKYSVYFRFDDILWASGTYNLTLGLSTFERTIQYIEKFLTINISDTNLLNDNSQLIRNKGVGYILNSGDIQFLKL
jgi:lipopolysaccharide transport system ATP-binding protein